MKNLVVLPISIMLLVFICSCKEEQVPIENDCTFVQNDDDMDGQIDDGEIQVMTNCRENAFSSVAAIESNLIGEWELIGFGHGWVNTISQPCAHILITENELVFDFQDASTNSVEIFQWEVVEVEFPSNPPIIQFRLQTVPEIPRGLFLTHFCEDFMFGDSTPSDGNMHLYRKVN